MRTALIVGSSGLVGGCCLSHLVERMEYARVVALVRRPSGRKDAGLEERVVDFDRLEEHKDAFAVDDVYACLGTTIKKAGSQERFRRVDHDYTAAVARLAAGGGASRFALVSSVGASERASSFYLRVKGETERDVAAAGFESLVIARPSLLVGERAENRPGERIGIGVARAVTFTLMGGLRKYRPIAADTVARALVAATLAGEQGTRILHFDELVAFGA